MSGDAAHGQGDAVRPSAPVRRRVGYAKPGDSKPDPRPAASAAGLLLVGGPFLLAAVLIKRDGFAIGGGDVKLMGACGFVLGVWPGLIQTVLSLSLAVLTGLVECRLQKQPLSAVRLPLAPFFCFGGVSAYWLTAFALQI